MRDARGAVMADVLPRTQVSARRGSQNGSQRLTSALSGIPAAGQITMWWVLRCLTFDLGQDSDDVLGLSAGSGYLAGNGWWGKRGRVAHRRSGCHRAEICRPGGGALRGRRHVLALLTRLAVRIKMAPGGMAGGCQVRATAQRRPLLWSLTRGRPCLSRVGSFCSSLPWVCWSRWLRRQRARGTVEVRW